MNLIYRRMRRSSLARRLLVMKNHLLAASIQRSGDVARLLNPGPGELSVAQGRRREATPSPGTGPEAHFGEQRTVSERLKVPSLWREKITWKKSQRRLKVQEPSLWREGEATLQNPSQGKFNTSTSETRLKRWTVQNPSLWREKISTTGRLKGSHAQCRSL